MKVTYNKKEDEVTIYFSLFERWHLPREEARKFAEKILKVTQKKDSNLLFGKIK